MHNPFEPKRVCVCKCHADGREDCGECCHVANQAQLSALRGELERVKGALRKIADCPAFIENDCEGDGLKAFAHEAEEIALAALARPEQPTLSGNELVGYGFAPGNYSCHCCVCGKTFEGDKRAVTCRECALAMKAKRPPEQQEQEQEQGVTAPTYKQEGKA